MSQGSNRTLSCLLRDKRRREGTQQSSTNWKTFTVYLEPEEKPVVKK